MFSLVSRTHFVLLSAIIALTIFALFLVPLDQDLPVHWGFDGVADGFMPAFWALVMPAILALALAILLWVLKRIPALAPDVARGHSLTEAAFSALYALMGVLLTMLILLGIGQDVDMVKIIVLSLLALLAVVGNYLPKTRPNRLAGLRIATTLNSEDNWRVTHFWTGRAMFVLAVIAIIIALIGASNTILLALVFGVIILPLLLGVYVSRRHG